ncbi:MAG: M48 family metalloprotease [Gammaproteobacteria bacterium]
MLVLPGQGGAAFASETLFDDEISRVLYRANETDDEIANADRIYNDNKVTLYLKAIMDKLYPEYTEVFRIRIYLSTEINAFVLPNGSVYVNLGLLATAGSEAQIASILSHEGAHYVQNHQLQKQQNLKDVVSGAEFFGFERSLTYLSDYSIELELEADNLGFDRLVNAGYDPNEAVKMFKTIADEIKLYDIKERNLYSTHPKIMERVHHFAELSRGHSGFVGKEAYLSKTSDLRVKDYDLSLSKYRFKSVLFALKSKNQIAQAPLEAWFYLGEAYRQRGEPSDKANAESAYLRAIELLPDFAPSYAALGVLYMKNNEYPKALTQFEKYLTLSPDSQNNAYIRQYYNDIKGKVSP